MCCRHFYSLSEPIRAECSHTYLLILIRAVPLCCGLVNAGPNFSSRLFYLSLLCSNAPTTFYHPEVEQSSCSPGSQPIELVVFQEVFLYIERSTLVEMCSTSRHFFSLDDLPTYASTRQILAYLSLRTFLLYQCCVSYVIIESGVLCLRAFALEPLGLFSWACMQSYLNGIDGKV